MVTSGESKLPSPKIRASYSIDRRRKPCNLIRPPWPITCSVSSDVEGATCRRNISCPPPGHWARGNDHRDCEPRFTGSGRDEAVLSFSTNNRPAGSRWRCGSRAATRGGGSSRNARATARSTISAATIRQRWRTATPALRAGRLSRAVARRGSAAAASGRRVEVRVPACGRRAALRTIRLAYGGRERPRARRPARC